MNKKLVIYFDQGGCLEDLSAKLQLQLISENNPWDEMTEDKSDEAREMQEEMEAHRMEREEDEYLERTAEGEY